MHGHPQDTRCVRPRILGGSGTVGASLTEPRRLPRLHPNPGLVAATACLGARERRTERPAQSSDWQCGSASNHDPSRTEQDRSAAEISSGDPSPHSTASGSTSLVRLPGGTQRGVTLEPGPCVFRRRVGPRCRGRPKPSRRSRGRTVRPQPALAGAGFAANRSVITNRALAAGPEEAGFCPVIRRPSSTT